LKKRCTAADQEANWGFLPSLARKNEKDGTEGPRKRYLPPREGKNISLRKEPMGISY